MSGKVDLRRRTRDALKTRFGGPVDSKGYVAWPQDTLVEGVRMGQFESDLRNGDGNELRMKFCALHSSAALAVNCFAPFKEKQGDLVLLGETGVTAMCFEQRLPIFLGGRAPNVDVWIERRSGNVAIESKFTEYMTTTKPKFSPAYERLAPPGLSEECWWRIYLDAKKGIPQLLDRAQLVKHYFGLRSLLWRENQRQDVTLLYLFWEPVNWVEFETCREHRKQVEYLSETVKSSSIPFRWMTYSHLWTEWAEQPHLAAHAENMRARYELAL